MLYLMVLIFCIYVCSQFEIIQYKQKKNYVLFCGRYYVNKTVVTNMNYFFKAFSFTNPSLIFTS